MNISLTIKLEEEYSFADWKNSFDKNKKLLNSFCDASISTVAQGNNTIDVLVLLFNVEWSDLFYNSSAIEEAFSYMVKEQQVFQINPLSLPL